MPRPPRRIPAAAQLGRRVEGCSGALARADGLPARAPRAHLAAARSVPAVAVQQRPRPGLRQLDRPATRLLPASVDDPDLSRVLGLWVGAPPDRPRVVLRVPC